MKIWRSRKALFTTADGHRDARRWGEAASAYRELLAVFPTLAHIWVQLGHVLKEDGRLEEALDAYRRALDLAPGVADTHLNIGHALKVAGRKNEASDAYVQALKLDPDCRPAMDELVALGEAWRLANVAGSEALRQRMGTIESLRSLLASLEARLPPSAALSSFPVEQYEAFRKRHRVAPPVRPVPIGGDRLSLVVLDDGSALGAIVEALPTMASQNPMPGDVGFFTNTDANGAAYERIRQSFGSRTAPAVVAPCNEWRSLLAAHVRSSPADWFLIARADARLSDSAAAWLLAAVHAGSAKIAYGDEEGPAEPLFLSVYDPEMVAGDDWPGSMLAVHRSVLRAELDRNQEFDIALLFGRLLRSAGKVAHVPRVLARRPSGISSAPRAAAPAVVSSSSGDRERICVAIPTKNGRDILHEAVTTLRDCAAAPGALDIVVVDNQSDEQATLDYLGEGRAKGWFTTLRDDQPFNWSRLNNIAVAQSDAGLLVFSNNDIEMTTKGWDDLVRAALSKKDVGAIGAKLVYPDGTLQHAGVIVGAGTSLEHEGVGNPESAEGAFGRWQRRRRVAAVTGAFQACRREVYDAVGGFDAIHLPIWYNDIDFCFRLRQRGLHILYEPAIVARHHESKTTRKVFHDEMRETYSRKGLQTMKERWGKWLSWDPGYNPHYDRSFHLFANIREPSDDEILNYIRLGSRHNPWAIDLAAD